MNTDQPPARRDRPARSAWHRVLRSPLLRPLNDVAAIDELLARVHPLWSLRRIRARVVEVIAETDDTRSFVLKANRRWPGFRAGQHVLLRHEIDGAIEQRCYSISTPPRGSRTLTITVKRQEHGHVSRRLCDALVAGTVVEIGAIAGEFVLPALLPSRLLLLSAGSGITPMRALLGDLRARGHDGEVVLLHSCRGTEDFIFGAELQALAQQWPALRIVMHDSSLSGRIDADGLRTHVADFEQWPTWACGPAAMLAWVRAAYRAANTEARLQIESFGAPVFEAQQAAVNTASAPLPVVSCSISEQVFTGGTGLPLLLEAESAGLQPKYGCRRGICRTCSCRKRSGSVQNLLTGVVSSQPDQWIQLCISVAKSDLELEL